MTVPLESIRFRGEVSFLNQLRAAFGLDSMVSNDEVLERSSIIYEHSLASLIRLSPVLAPRLFRLLNVVRERLGYREAADLLVAPSTDINASSFAAPTAGLSHLIALTAGLVEKLSDDEMLFVLGHEVGHLAFRHGRYSTLQSLLRAPDEENGEPNDSLLLRKIRRLDRLAELSADRAGLIACGGSIETALSTMLKVASGLGAEHLSFDAGAFLEQLRLLQGLTQRQVMDQFSHPVMPVRARALQLWRGIGAGAAKEDELARVDAEILSLARIMEFRACTPLQTAAREVLLAGGRLLQSRSPSAEQQRTILSILLGFCTDPEEDLAQITSQSQAMQLLDSGCRWLADHGGQERFGVLRALATAATGDGRIDAAAEEVLQDVAHRLGIPDRAAREVFTGALTNRLKVSPVVETNAMSALT